MSDLRAIDSAIVRYRDDPHYLLQILREAQEAFDWISPETTQAVASRLEIPRTRIESLVRFYSFLYDKPRGVYRLLFSDNITDRMAGQPKRCSSTCSPAWRSSAARSRPTGLRQRRSDLLHRHVRSGSRRCWSTIAPLRV